MKGLEFMILTLKPKTGRTLKSRNSLSIDQKTSMAGYKIGYIPKDQVAYGGEPILVPIGEWNQLLRDFNSEPAPKKPLIARLGQYMIDNATPEVKTQQGAISGQQQAIPWVHNME